MSARYDAIDQTLRRVRARLRANDALLAVGWLGCAIAAVLFGALLLALVGAPVATVRPWFLAISALVLVAGAGIAARPFLRAWTDDAIAALVGRKDRRISDRLLSAVQLHRDADRLSRDYSLSRELIDLHVDATADEAAAVDPSDLFDRRRTNRLLAGGLASLAAAVLIAAVFPGLFARAKAFAIGLPPGAKTEPTQSAAAGTAPRLGDVSVTYRYPDYTGREPETFEGTDGNLKALKGTVAEITVKSDRPVKSAEINLNGKEPLKLEVHPSADGGATTLVGEIPLLEEGAYTIEAKTANGTAAADKSPRTIQIEPDDVPNVQIVWPVEETTEVNELEDVIVTWGAEDDYGLKQVDLVWENHPPEESAAAHGAKKPKAKAAGRIPLASFPHEMPLRHGDQYKWALSTLSLEPGGYVEYWVEATDNDTVSGPKRGKSAKHYLRLLSSEQIHEKVVALQDLLLKRMLGLLADHLEYDPKALDVAKVATDAERFEGRTHEVAAAFDEIENALLKDPLGDEVVYKELRKIHADVTAIDESYSQRVLESAARSAADPAQGRRDAFLGARAEAIPTLEKDTLFLDKLIEKERFDGARQELANLSREQKDLKKMLEDYKKGGVKDADMARALEQKLAQIEQKMMEIGQKMASTMQSMPADFDNSALDQDLMSQIRKALDEGRLDDAAALTEKMLKGLDDMVAQMDNVEQQFNLDPETAKQLGDVQKELGKLSDEQRKLAEDTSRIRSQIQKRADESGKKVEEFVKKEQEKVKKLREQLDDLQRQGMLDPAMRSIVNSARFGVERNLQDLEASLKSGELQESLNDAEQIENELEGVQRAPESLGMNRPGDSPDPRTMDAANKAQSQAHSIVKDLDQLRQQFENNATPEERQKLAQMGQSQQKLQQQAQGLAQRMGQLSQKSPFVPNEAGQSVQQAADSMSEAQGQLQGGNAAGAVPPERKAADQLGQAQAQLNGSGQSPRGSGQGMMPLAQRMGGNNHGWDGRNGFSTEKVEIPDGSQFRVPKEFREDILEAMKKASPDGYKQLNQEYYERLIK